MPDLYIYILYDNSRATFYSKMRMRRVLFCLFVCNVMMHVRTYIIYNNSVAKCFTVKASITQTYT